MAAFTHVYAGSPGYRYVLESGVVDLNPGDKVELSKDEAASIGEDFQPIGKAKAAPSTDTPEEG